jgi:hypothetical protein
MWEMLAPSQRPAKPRSEPATIGCREETYSSGAGLLLYLRAPLRARLASHAEPLNLMLSDQRGDEVAPQRFANEIREVR